MKTVKVTIKREEFELILRDQCKAQLYGDKLNVFRLPIIPEELTLEIPRDQIESQEDIDEFTEEEIEKLKKWLKSKDNWRGVGRGAAWAAWKDPKPKRYRITTVEGLDAKYSGGDPAVCRGDIVELEEVNEVG